jgi:hypothetical protein
MKHFSFKFLFFVVMVDILGSAAVDVTAVHRYSSTTGDWSLPVHGSGRDDLAVLRSLYEYNDKEISYEDLKNNHDFQEWKESQLTDEDRQKQQEEEEKRQEEYRQQQQEYQDQMMQQEMEMYLEYLAWKNQTAWKNETVWKNETSYGDDEEEDSSTSGLSFIDTNVLSEGRQWTIGSSMLLVGILAGFGAAMMVTRHKNKSMAKARPLLDDSKADLA